MNAVSPINGHEVRLLRQVIQMAGANKVIYTLSNGTYMGSIIFDGMSNDALKMMAADFQAFITESVGGIVQVPAGARLPAPPQGRAS